MSAGPWVTSKTDDNLPGLTTGFWLLLISRGTLVAGAIVQIIAVNWLALTLGGSSFTLGLLMATLLLPGLIVALFGGVAIDRYNPRLVAQAMDLVRAVAIAGLPVIALVDEVKLWHVFVVTAVTGVGNAVAQPTFVLLLGQLTPDDGIAKKQLVRSNALGQLATQIGAVTGTAGGGLLIAIIGTEQALWCTTIGYLGSFFLLAGVRHNRKPSILDNTRLHIASDIRAAVRVLAGNHQLLVAAMGACLSLAFIQAFNVLAAPYVKEELASGVVGYGFFSAAWAIGALLAALLCLRLGAAQSDLRWHLASHLSIAGLTVVLVCMPTFLSATLAAIVLSTALSSANIIHPAYLQHRTPEAYVGRVLGIVQWGMSGLSLVFAVGAGLLGAVIPLRLAFGGWSLLFVTVAAVMWLVVRASAGTRESDLRSVLPLGTSEEVISVQGARL